MFSFILGLTTEVFSQSGRITVWCWLWHCYGDQISPVGGLIYRLLSSHCTFGTCLNRWCYETYKDAVNSPLMNSRRCCCQFGRAVGYHLHGDISIVAPLKLYFWTGPYVTYVTECVIPAKATVQDGQECTVFYPLPTGTSSITTHNLHLSLPISCW